MPLFDSAGVSISYDVYGEGRPLLLIHGFASSGAVNWLNTGWTQTLVEAGYQAITIDNRGHGQSQKLYAEDAYWAHEMAEDAARLLEHLGIEKAGVIGYSMGARISSFLALQHRDMVAALVLGGMGLNLVSGLADSDEIITGLRAPNLSDITHPTARQFRIFADHSKADRLALASCMVASREPMAESYVKTIDVPALVAVGEVDDMAVEPFELAKLLPQGEAFVIPKRNHMLATGDARFKQAALEFLARVYPSFSEK